MQSYRLVLQPLSALGTPLAGDTLFGQLCWALRHIFGEQQLRKWLQDYGRGKPFAVVSSALPHGHVPLPQLPSTAWEKATGADRKALKQKQWLPLTALDQPLPQWQTAARSQEELGASKQRAQPHNTINRQSGTTGSGPFAPYTMPQTWLASGALLDLWMLLDTDRVAPEQIQAGLQYMGQSGFGRDASIGLGKFSLAQGLHEQTLPGASAHTQPNAWLTLGPSAPQGLGFCPRRSHWRVLTRFGRHGDLAVHLGNPFKQPVLLADVGSVFWPDTITANCSMIGQGLGGVHAPLSAVMPETVHQGYSPVLPIHVPQDAVGASL